MSIDFRANGRGFSTAGGNVKSNYTFYVGPAGGAEGGQLNLCSDTGYSLFIDNYNNATRIWLHSGNTDKNFLVINSTETTGQTGNSSGYTNIPGLRYNGAIIFQDSSQYNGFLCWCWCDCQCDCWCDCAY